MADDKNDGFDLTQFYQIFFEEAGENLEQMEQQLLNLDLETVDDEELNAIFRCAHSIKGGAATFGFEDVAELTHQMESLLDKLRRHELAPTMPMVDVLLEASDALKGLLARHQGLGGEPPETAGLVQRIRVLASGGAAVPPPPPAPVPPPPPAPAPGGMPAASAPGAARQLQAVIGPLDHPEQAEAIKELFRDIEGLGTITGERDDGGRKVYLIDTTSSDADLLDLFAFHVAKEKIALLPAGAAPAPAPVAPPAPAAAAAEGSGFDHSQDIIEQGYGLFAGAPGSPVASTVPGASGAPVPADDLVQGYGLFPGAPGNPLTPRAHADIVQAESGLAAGSAAAPAESKAREGAKATRAAATAQLETTSLRVSVSKIDQLINQVGELVITQAMLAQNSRSLDATLNQQLLSGLADLERNTRDLQESVMSIRMIPMSVVFSRFPRMLRDLASKLGKKVELLTHGEATELDKGLIEKITDPLTHLIRNSCDHGIEQPDERLAKGKPEIGTITLSAAHQGGSILIEVRDDGKGLSRQKLIDKARAKGIPVSDDMPDQEAWQLIFAPGFSTAEVVTDVSGRGVGMDVVKKNIAALGGSVELDSSEGFGMSVKVRLPLTLAIMDGMTVRVADEVYILPLSSVVESFQVQAKDINTVAQNAQLVKVRDEYMPVIEVDRLFAVPRPAEATPGNTIMVVIESDGSRVALMVDELLGQQQVVIKNLESNYRKVQYVSGATILGDGSVSLILDTSSLVRRARQ
ncbi:chemotaxis protein CheW [Aquabacterium sp. A08]|uniref:chemotaxis protein CheW n=1 Tax=Aquabacterium sp. A08 TaxID=2718532 RepID=UPI001423FAA4|nr:chemotaxis protein CheW [Aquabacterium sp. A08]NIC41944.1 chemotaxis protein CheA [Aquabacterium sp. A08]NIC41987.1 chemotaxis protein CheA [Aquabacterium sp. A08]